MDPQARRFIWKVIGKLTGEMKKCSVILTTHCMEEAEVLSTKLAIMMAGKIQCIGSVQHLKHKYGQGYDLEIKIETPNEDEKKFIKQKVGILKDQKNLSVAQLKRTLEMVKMNDLFQNMYEEQTKHITKEKDRINVRFSTDLVILRIDHYEKEKALENFLNATFVDTVFIDNHLAIYRYSVSNKVKISKIFGELERNKRKLHFE